jgi:hypothetical protein
MPSSVDPTLENVNGTGNLDWPDVVASTDSAHTTTTNNNTDTTTTPDDLAIARANKLGSNQAGFLSLVTSLPYLGLESSGAGCAQQDPTSLKEVPATVKNQRRCDEGG